MSSLSSFLSCGGGVTTIHILLHHLSLSQTLFSFLPHASFISNNLHPLLFLPNDFALLLVTYHFGFFVIFVELTPLNPFSPIFPAVHDHYSLTYPCTLIKYYFLFTYCTKLIRGYGYVVLYIYIHIHKLKFLKNTE